MNKLGYDQPLHILPFDHRGSFQNKLFGWSGALTADQTAQIAASKQVIYDGFKAAARDEVPDFRAGILVGEQFGAAILKDAWTHHFTTACPAEKAARQNSNLNTAKTSPLHAIVLADEAAMGQTAINRKGA